MEQNPDLRSKPPLKRTQRLFGWPMQSGLVNPNSYPHDRTRLHGGGGGGGVEGVDGTPPLGISLSKDIFLCHGLELALQDTLQDKIVIWLL